MRPIDADRLLVLVVESMENNPHVDPKVKSNHTIEHQHFLRMIEDMETLHYHIDEVEGHFE